MDAATEFAKALRSYDGEAWLVMLGNSGVGKTHLAQRIWDWWCKTGRWYVEEGTGANLTRSGQFCRWSDFIAECKRGDFSRAEDLAMDYFVVLDDIGAGAEAKGWVADKLYHVLEMRLVKKLPTILTANLSMEQLAERYDARIASRLVRRGADKVVHAEAQDFKLRDSIL